ncbi:MAG TPA: prepilin-type N-terminal cleavage/methylation domain-containing protein [Candidatus Deferrimicrobium sp.]|nr:prepilin-type N-terminal cleavage/methylation domain-containing protein [Candidatus Deferrimicrobium sp.]
MTATKLVNEDGLTLLEVMIAMVIMAISLLLLLNMAMVALDGNDWSNKTTIATQLLQEKLEQLRTTANPQSGGDTTLGVSRVWTVSSAGGHLREVDISITWENIQAEMVSDSIKTFIKTDSV